MEALLVDAQQLFEKLLLVKPFFLGQIIHFPFAGEETQNELWRQ